MTTPHASDEYWAGTIPAQPQRTQANGKGGKIPSKDHVGIGAPYGIQDGSAQAFALRFLREHGGELLVAFDDKGRATVYGTDGSGVWRENHSRFGRLLSDDAENWAAEGIKVIIGDDGNAARKAGELARAAKHVHSSRGQADVIATAGSAYDKLQALGKLPPGITSCEDRDLDADLRYLGAPNGVVDLWKQKLLTGTQARRCLVTRHIPDPWNPKAKHPDFDRLLNHLDAVDREYILDAAGYALRGIPSRRINVIEGPPSRGKTTLITAIRASVGDVSDRGYGLALSHTALVLDRWSNANSHSEHLKDLPHARIATSAELPDRPSDTALLKKISGSDPLTPRA